MTITIKAPCAAKPVPKKKSKALKKAPQAPKRFKSSYILFFIHVQEDIKKSLPVGHKSAPEVSKRASEMWKSISAEDRLHWDNEAAKEKQRYLAEKKVYTGPWQVPHKRAKKDPTAPKRNPSAFLLFSLTKRKELKQKNPGLKNTEISSILGNLWRNTSQEEKRPFVEREQIERDKYKVEMSAWREKKAEDDEAKKNEAAEKTELALEKAAAQSVASANGGGDNNMSYQSAQIHQPLENDSFLRHSYMPSSSPPLNLTACTSSNYGSDPACRSSNYGSDPACRSSNYGSDPACRSSNYGSDPAYRSSNYGSDPYHQYGQLQGWPSQSESHQSRHHMNLLQERSNHHLNRHHMNTSPDRFNPFDGYHNNPAPPPQQLGFEQNMFYEPNHQQRSIKYETGAESPYSYNDEFDPVPIH